MHPDDDALVDIVTGQAVAPEVTAHVAGCPRCADELTDLREVVGLVREPEPELLPVPQRVWDAVSAGLDTPAVASPRPVTRGRHHTADGTASDELAARRTGRTRRRVALGWVVGAAAAGLVLGGAGATLLAREDPAAGAVTVASASLDTLDTRRAMGSAEVVRHDARVDLAVHTEPMDPDGGYLEVWLINRDLTRMVSVGVLRPDQRDQSFAVPQALLDQGYVIVDISREGFDDRPEHSGDSLVRGTLAT